MKIAVCLYGHLRTWEHCYESLKKNLLDLYDCDVFMHTWDTVDAKTQSWHDDLIKENCMVAGVCEKLFEKYGLKDLMVETQADMSNEYGYYHPVNLPERNVSIWGVNCMWHSIEQVNSLRLNYQKINDIDYDFIIFTRPDILFLTNINLVNYIKDLDMKDINKALFCFADPIYGNNTPRINDGRYAAGNDLFFFAKPEIIDNIINNKNCILNQITDDKTLQRTVESLVLELAENLNYKYYFIGYILFGTSLKTLKVLRHSEINPATVCSHSQTHLQKHTANLVKIIKSLLHLPQEFASVMFYLIYRK